MTGRVLLLILLLVIALFLGIVTGEARQLRESVFNQPDAKQTIQFNTKKGDKEEMTRADYVLSIVAKGKMNAITYWLINEPVSFLWAIIYGITGFAGACVYLLLLVIAPDAVGHDPRTVDVEFQTPRLIARFAVAAAAGVLAYFVAILPADVALLAIKLPKLGQQSESDVYGLLLLLPAAAGIFISTFFSKIGVWLTNTMTRREKQEPKPNNDGGGG